MQPYFYTGTQPTLTISFFFIFFANLSTMKADGAYETEARADINQGGLFPALGVDKTIEVLNIISDSTTAFQASKDTVKNGNTTASEDDIIVSDETEDESENEEEDEDDDEEELDELEEDDGSEEDELEEDEDEDEELEEEEEEESFQADVRSLSDLPLYRLLKVRGELQRIEENEVRAFRGGANPSLANVAKATTAALGAAAAAFNNKLKNRHRSSPSHVSSRPTYQGYTHNLPSEQKKATDSEDSKEAPPRRGGWHFDEEEEEEEIEEDHGWISGWPKGKKKKKGDISSVFQMSVTFLAFLAFGGYLLCLIVQAVKGGGPTGPSGDGYRPPMQPMVLMMPARLGVRRPRPPNPGRRRRRKRRRRRDTSRSPGGEVPWPTWDDPFDADASGRLWPNADLSSLQRVLLDISRELADNGRILR